MEDTIVLKVTLTTETCSSCGVPFGIPSEFMKQREEDHKKFYCPNGHALYYGENATERRIKRLEENVQWWKNEAEQAQRSLSATRGVLTKAKKRIANGVCPCCHRQFVNLQRHMAGKHPDYVASDSIENIEVGPARG